MRSWDQKADFRDLLRQESDVITQLGDELEGLFDYGYYTRYVDQTFQRAGVN